jgi:proline-specific peptidase
MSTSRTASEGYVPFHGYRTWYRIVGDAQPASGRASLLLLHGGPGVPHDYMENLEALADAGRQVIFYDQLGCGNSDQPHNPDLWVPELFVEEVGAVRQALGLDRVHILGSSWGGMLGMLYALTQPSGLLSLIIESSPASVPRWMEELRRLRDELPAEVEATLARHEAEGTTSDPAYQEAMLVFYRRHVCRLEQWPEYVNRSFAKLAQNDEVYQTMNGPSEFHVIGRLKGWDISGRLGEIRVPTLIISGQYDEVTPATMEIVHRGITGSQWELMEGCSHLSHVEQPERFMAIVNEFLARVEGIAAP